MGSESIQVAADQSRELTVELIGREVAAMVADAPEGDPIDPQTRALVELAVRVNGMTLDLQGTREYLERALDAGATAEQIGELMVMISGMGIHGLIGTSQIVHDVLVERGHPAFGAEFTPEQQEVWDRVGGGDEREARIARIAPEFLPNLVRLVPEGMFKAVVDFRASPWFGKTMTPYQLELIGVAVDMMHAHRFLPTLRMHVHRAVEFGAGRIAIGEVTEIAAAAPAHRGVW